MANPNKLSIVAEFDDLMRMHYALTAPIETDFIRFVESSHRNFKRMEQEHHTALEEKENLNQSKERMMAQRENKVKNLELKLLHAQEELNLEIERRTRLERHLDLVRDVMLNPKDGNLTSDQRNKLAFMYKGTSPNLGLGEPTLDTSGSLLHDYSVDQTVDMDESMLRNGKRYKRPSAPPEPTPPAKRQSHDRVVATSTITADMATGEVSADTEVHPRGVSIYPKLAPIPASPASVASNMLPRTPVNRLRLAAGGSLNKPHEFVAKSILKLEHCPPCGKKCKFGKPALKCRTCGIVCHEECASTAQVPCFPVTPKHKQAEARLLSYAPAEPPYVPSLIVHCVREIENRGFAPGLYRECGSIKDIKELKDRFMNEKGGPQLNSIEIHTLAGCLRLFLRDLKDCLIPSNRFREFVSVRDQYQLQDLVETLPYTNRDTLAYLALHFIRVAECEETKMDFENLARILAPTLVGITEAADQWKVTEQSKELLVRLFGLPYEFWGKFIHGEVNSDGGVERVNAEASPLLGRIKSNKGRRGRSRTQTTPAKVIKSAQRKFFQSPMLL